METSIKFIDEDFQDEDLVECSDCGFEFWNYEQKCPNCGSKNDTSNIVNTKTLSQ